MKGTIAVPVPRVGLATSLLTLLFVLFFAFLAIYQLSPPPAAPINAPPTAFSADRAMPHLEVIAREPHPMGSPEHARVRDYIVQQLTDMGVVPEIQQTTAVNPRGFGAVSSGTVQNIIARQAGTASTRAIMIVAHYDAVLTGPGANDDGVGVVAMLETLRAIRAGPPLQNDLILLFTDGEESGLLGARAFVNEHPLAAEVGVVLNLEARGSSGPVLMFETSNENGWLIQEFARAAPYPISSSLFYDVYQYLPNDTDFTVFKGAGMSGMNFAYIDGFLRYHTALDNVENVDKRSLQHHGSYALALARHFGAIDLQNTKQRDAVYFNILGPIFVQYSRAWVVPLLVVVALLFVGVVILGFRSRQLTFSGIAVGFFAFLASLVLVLAAVALVLFLVFTLHPGYRLIPHGELYNSNLYIISFVALAVAIFSALYNLFRRRIRVQNLMVGALIWWLVLAALTSLYFQGGSYLFVWPLLFSLVGLAILFASEYGERVLERRFVALLLCSIPGIILFAPLLSLLFVALTTNLAVPIMVVAVLLLGLLIPHLTFMEAPNKWLLPIAAALVSLGFLGAGSLTSGFDANRPRPDNVLYGLNADTGQAVWASSDPQPDEWTAQFLSGNVERGPLPTFFPQAPLEFIQSQAPTLPLPPPEVALDGDSTSDGVRTLRLHITSQRQAPLLWVYADPRMEVLGAAVNGVPIDLDDAPARPGAPPPPDGGVWGLEYWGLPAEGIELTLEVSAAQPVTIRVVERTQGLPDIPGQSITPRPDYIMPAPQIGIARLSNSTMVSRSFTF